MPMTFAVFREKMKDRKYVLAGAKKCAKCDVELQETITGNRKSHLGNVCSDCYYDIFGEEMEKNSLPMHRLYRER